MSSLTAREVSVCKLVGVCEGIAGSGLLNEDTEKLLREYIADACKAFGIPSVAERPSARVIQIGDHDPEYAQTIDIVRVVMGARQ